MITEIDAKCQGLAISNSGLQKRKAAKVLADLSEAVFETSPVKLQQFMHFCQGSRALTMQIFKRCHQILQDTVYQIVGAPLGVQVKFHEGKIIPVAQGSQGLESHVL